MKRRNISLLTLLLLLLCSANVNAQGPRFGQPEMPGGMKDSYKDYFSIGVAVNQRNVSNPDQIALIKKEFNSITA